MNARIYNCFSCAVCDLTARRCCKEHQIDLCLGHYVIHLENDHGLNVLTREGALEMAERSMHDQIVC